MKIITDCRCKPEPLIANFDRLYLTIEEAIAEEKTIKGGSRWRMIK